MQTEFVAIAGMGVVAETGTGLGPIPNDLVLRGCSDEELKQHIGKRGIRYKDKATRLALAAARVAMQQAALAPNGYHDSNDLGCAVVVASCFGNVDTVLRVAGQIAAQGSMALSPMDLPNASANVLAATLAIWFGLRGPNLMLASGDQAGNDALLFACNLLRNGAVERVLLCGAETEQPDLARLFASTGGSTAGPINIAAALVLERVDSQRSNFLPRALLGLEAGRLGEPTRSRVAPWPGGNSTCRTATPTISTVIRRYG